MDELTSKGRARRRLVALTTFVLASTGAVACSRKLAQEDCDAFLGRGIGLLAYASASEEPFTVESVRARAREREKKAIAGFDAACVGAADDGQRDCGRYANNIADFAKCGPVTQKARDAAVIAQDALAKKHNADECSKYAEHAVKIGLATPDDAGKYVRECDEFMNVGVFRCRMEANDAATWRGCE
jgi:hypothetical protein